MKSPKELIQSVAHAIHGFFLTLKEESSAKIQFTIGIITIFMGIYFNISKTEWIALILCVVGVLGAETMNSAIENLSDRVTTEQDPLIKKTKDMAAGAVLIIAIGAIIIGGLIFIPKFIH